MITMMMAVMIDLLPHQFKIKRIDQDSQDIVNTQEINLNRYPELRNLKQAVIKIEEQMMMNLLATKTEKHEKST